MNRQLGAFLGASFILWNMIGSAAAKESCGRLREIASAPMDTMPDGLAYVPAVIKGQSLNFLLQTELRGSMIKGSAAAALALPRERIIGWKVTLQGDRLQDFATADAMQLGGLTGKVRFAVGPDDDFRPAVSGALAADFLRNFDVDFDFAKSRLNLFSPDHCEGGVVYWTKSGASLVPMKVSPWGELGVATELDGKSIWATLATGQSKSILFMAEDETKFGTPDKEWKLVKAGEYHGSPVLYEHVFKTLTVGGIEVDNVDLMIQSGARPYVGAQLALGMDILRQLHLYVAYKERNLYASAANAAAPLAQATQQSPTAQAH